MCVFRFIKWIDAGLPIQLFGDGSAARDFTYVDDIAIGTIAALADVGYEVINLGGGGTPISMNQLISSCGELLGKEPIVQKLDTFKADMAITSADISKAKKLIGWSPETDFDTGLKASVAWHIDNKPWSEDIVLP